MASELFLTRQGPRLLPSTLADAEVVDGLSSGTEYRAVLTRAQGRSIRHHRLLFGLIKIIRDNYPEPLTTKAITGTLKLLTGHVEVVKLATGQIVMTPSSISFEAMDQDAFNKWFPKAVDAMCREFVPGLTADDAMREIELIANGRAAA